MVKGIRLTKASFVVLYEKIKEVHKKDYADLSKKSGDKNYRFPPGESAVYFGFDENLSSDIWSLFTAMRAKQEVQNYLRDGDYTLSAKKLYYLLADFKKNKKRSTDTVLLKDQYEKVYFIYAGFDDIHDFMKKNLKDKTLVRKHQEALLTLGEKEFSGYETKYKGYYYSFRHHKVKEFDLRIDYINNFLVEEKGLHANELEPYTGTAKHRRNYLMMNLSNDNEGVLSFLGFIGAQYPETLGILTTTYQTLSSITGHPIAREAVLIKKELVNDKSKLDIARYLMTQRRNYRIRPQIYDKTNKLSPKGYNLDYLDHMIGHYVIWSLNRRKSIIQARWVLNSDHKSFLYSGVENGRQVCLFMKSETAGNPKLCVITYTAQGVNILNFALIDLPNKAGPPVEYLNAVFVTKGIREAVATYAVFMKVAKDYKPKIGELTEEELEVLLEEKKYVGLKDKLFELVKQQQIPL